MRYSKKILQDPQLLFNFVAENLWKQRQKSPNLSGYCQYRLKTPDKKILKCTAGWCIPDSVYTSEIEDTPIQCIIEDCRGGYEFTAFPKLVGWANSISYECAAMMKDMQSMHDDFILVDKTGNFNPGSFYIKFLHLAERKNLDTAFLKKLCGKDKTSEI